MSSSSMESGARGRSALVAAAAVGVLVGLALGAYWHAPIARLFGGGGAAAAPAGSKQLWTCSMHPQVIRDKPGLCPICHMELTPLKAGPAQPSIGGPAVADGAVVIDAAVVQNMGVRAAPVTEGPLRRTIRLFGYLDEAQPNIRDVNLRVTGWSKKLHAATEGMRVEAGDPLLDVYSPDLQLAIDQLIAARRAASSGQSPEGARTMQGSLLDAAIRRLELLGLDRRQIEALAKLDKAPEVVTFTSPISGIVTEKPVVEGAAVKSGDRALR